jgi:hypothetical protein
MLVATFWRQQAALKGRKVATPKGPASKHD